MAEIRLRKNGTTHHLEWCGSGVPCEERFAFRYNGSIYYVPAMSTQGTKVLGGIYNSLRWYYDTSSPTIAFRKNGKTYYCNKSFITEQVISYDIPAGTYVGQSAYNIFKNFISNNSYRTLKYSVTITHNGISRTFPANTKVWLIYGYSGNCINLIFQTGSTPTSGVDLGATNNNNWWSSSTDNPGIQLRLWVGNYSTTPWSSNNFTISGGIKFN